MFHIRADHPGKSWLLVSAVGALLLAACHTKPPEAHLPERAIAQTYGAEPVWSFLSRQATEEFLNGRNDRALALITESVNVAEKSAGVPLSTLLSLRCKQCQVLYVLSKRSDALAVARACLRQLSGGDWKQQLLASRFLDVERACFMDVADYANALKSAELLGAIDEYLMGPNSLETMRRRVRLVEIEFMLRQFDRVIEDGEKIDKYLCSSGLGEDPDEALLLIYLGAARLQLGQVERGREDLQRASEVAEVVGNPFLPNWVQDFINTMPQSKEIHSLLKRPVW